MISIVGLGNAASAIVDCFKETPQYNVYKLNSSIKRSSKYNFKLKKYDTPEEYESNIPKVDSFFSELDDRVQFFITGASLSSNYSLGILEQIKHKQIDVFYIKPDTELLSGVPILVENVVFGVLQEYARSGLLNSFTCISNVEVEACIGDLPIKTYYESMNNFIFSAVHHLNYFLHSEPEIGQV